MAVMDMLHGVGIGVIATLLLGEIPKCPKWIGMALALFFVCAAPLSRGISWLSGKWRDRRAKAVDVKPIRRTDKGAGDEAST